MVSVDLKERMILATRETRERLKETHILLNLFKGLYSDWLVGWLKGVDEGISHRKQSHANFMRPILPPRPYIVNTIFLGT